jgi:hypothetical protein
MLRCFRVGFLWASRSALVISATAVAIAAELPRSDWVYSGPDGRLVYKTTPAGDKIMDFSHAGYLGGGVALPLVAVRRTLQPSGSSDETAAIQAAVNEVSALKLENGFRGAVLLGPGVFPCSNTVTIPASGVVLRGSGDGTQPGPKTTLKLTGKPHLAIAVRTAGERRRGSTQSADGGGTDARQEFIAAETSIADTYVPSGTSSFTVASTSGFAVGDTIELRRPVTSAWIRFMQMHDLVRDGRSQTWLGAGSTTITERHITAIAGKTLTVDVPLSDSFDSRYLQPPGTTVVKIRPPLRITQAGIEQLHIECPAQPINHTQPHFTALRITGQDCWVRDVACDETMNSIAVSGQRITLQRVTVNRKARHQGSSRPAEFAPNAGQVLLDRCAVNADNIWFVATGGRQAGPIVLLNCTFFGDSRAESHQRWSTGMLYDNCRAPQGGIEYRNRGSMGSGHGWSMGWGVVWNCVAKDYVIQNPPGAANWMIGCVGESTRKPRPFGNAPLLPEGIQDSPGKPVTPQSLYLAQLAERLGPQAVKHIGY